MVAVILSLMLLSAVGRKVATSASRGVTDAANEAGISRRYGGIHFRGADLAGRLLGRIVAFEAWQKAKTYFDGP